LLCNFLYKMISSVVNAATFVLIFFNLSFWRQMCILSAVWLSYFFVEIWHPIYLNLRIDCAVGETASQIWYWTSILCFWLRIRIKIWYYSILLNFIIFLLPSHFWCDNWTIIIAVSVRLETLFLQYM